MFANLRKCFKWNVDTATRGALECVRRRSSFQQRGGRQVANALRRSQSKFLPQEPSNTCWQLNCLHYRYPTYSSRLCISTELFSRYSDIESQPLLKQVVVFDAALARASSNSQRVQTNMGLTGLLFSQLTVAVLHFADCSLKKIPHGRAPTLDLILLKYHSIHQKPTKRRLPLLQI